MRTTSWSAANNRDVTIGISHMLPCSSIRFGTIRTAAFVTNYPVVAVFCIGSSRNGNCIGIDPAGHIAAGAIGERQATCG